MSYSRSPGVRFALGGPLTPVVKRLIIVNSLAYFFIMISAVSSQEIYGLLGLIPSRVFAERAFWQPFTYMFIHDTSIWHVLFNMLYLWWFGSEMERAWGSRLFTRYYIMAGLFGAFFVIANNWQSGQVTIGASAAVMAVLLAYGVSFPQRIIIFIIIPMKAWLFVLISALIELVSLTNSTSNISHAAHVGGLTFGMGWFLYYTGRLRMPSLRKLMHRRKMRRHLKIVRNDEAAKGSSKETDKKENNDDIPTIH